MVLVRLTLTLSKRFEPLQVNSITILYSLYLLFYVIFFFWETSNIKLSTSAKILMFRYLKCNFIFFRHSEFSWFYSKWTMCDLMKNKAAVEQFSIAAIRWFCGLWVISITMIIFCFGAVIATEDFVQRHDIGISRSIQ